MSEREKVGDRKFGQNALKTIIGNKIDAEQLANICYRLGISETLDSSVRASSRHSIQKQEKTMPINQKTKQTTDSIPFEQFDESANSSVGACGFGKNSYSKESWGRDSGARDLSPEPSSRPAYELSVTNQLVDSETGGTTAMLQLASKVSTGFDFLFSSFFNMNPSKITDIKMENEHAYERSRKLIHRN